MSAIPILVAELSSEVIFPGCLIPWVFARDECPPEIVEGATVAVFCRRMDGSHPYREGLGGLHDIGCSARVAKLVAKAELTLVLEGTRRVRIAEVTRSQPHLVAHLVAVPEWDEDDEAARIRASMVREVAKAVVRRTPGLPREAVALIESVPSPGRLADLLAMTLHLTLEEKAAFLSSCDARVRLERVLPILVCQSELLEMRERVLARVDEELRARDPALLDPQELRALQRRLLVEEVEVEPALARPAIGGLLRRLLGGPSTRRRLETELEEIQARARREAKESMLRALDAQASIRGKSGGS